MFQFLPRHLIQLMMLAILHGLCALASLHGVIGCADGSCDDMQVGSLLQTLETRNAPASRSFSYGDLQLEGYIAEPVGVEPKGVVIHLPTWEGLSDFEKAQADRTALEWGYLSFAASIYTPSETEEANSLPFPAVFPIRKNLTARYSANDGALFIDRIEDAVSYIRGSYWPADYDTMKIAMMGYCFGGEAVMQYVRFGKSHVSGVLGVVSFHSKLDALQGSWGGPFASGGTPTLVLNGYNDHLVPHSEIHVLQDKMTNANITWEFTNYGHAGHGFTHPDPPNRNPHFHFEAVANERSWESSKHFVDTVMGVQHESVTPRSRSRSVKYTDGAVELDGFLSYTKKESGTPVVLVMPSWDGMNDEEQEEATRITEQLGVVSFAIEIFNKTELAAVRGPPPGVFQVREALMDVYESEDVSLIHSRVAAALEYLRSCRTTRGWVDLQRVALVGKAFGGSLALHVAQEGWAPAFGVQAVASLTGNLHHIYHRQSVWCPTWVMIVNGATDDVPGHQIQATQASLEASHTHWELTNYSNVGKAFTDPTPNARAPGFNSVEYNALQRHRALASLAEFLSDAFAGKGTTASCDSQNTA